jgi:hypothetical protein
MARVMVTGSRNWTDPALYGALLFHTGRGDTLVHGGARGADLMAAAAATRIGLTVEEHKADWRRWGNAAGPIRNTEMLNSGIDLVLAFQVADSRGTAHAISEAERLGIPVKRWACDTPGGRVREVRESDEQEVIPW